MPLTILKVVADTPELGQGDTAENPMPAPKATNTRVSAAAVTPPAITAAQETAEGSLVAVLDVISVLVAFVMAGRSGARSPADDNDMMQRKFRLHAARRLRKGEACGR